MVVRAHHAAHRRRARGVDGDGAHLLADVGREAAAVGVAALDVGPEEHFLRAPSVHEPPPHDVGHVRAREGLSVETAFGDGLLAEVGPLDDGAARDVLREAEDVERLVLRGEVRLQLAVFGILAREVGAREQRGQEAGDDGDDEYDLLFHVVLMGSKVCGKGYGMSWMDADASHAQNGAKRHVATTAPAGPTPQCLFARFCLSGEAVCGEAVRSFTLPPATSVDCDILKASCIRSTGKPAN